MHLHLFESYIRQLDEESARTIKHLIQLLRKLLPGYREEVKWNMPVFIVDDQDFVGLAIRKGYISLYVPHYELVEKYLPTLGKVSTGKSCIRFRQLEDLNLDGLENLLLEVSLKKAADSK